MAYDKVVDSSVLDAGLKQIANAIREKGGTSDNLAFPTAMADAIAAIEAGGGGGGTSAWGTVTPSTYTASIYVGVEIPADNFYFAVTTVSTPTKTSSAYMLCGYFVVQNGVTSGQFLGASKSTSGGAVANSPTASAIHITIDRTNKTITFETKGGTVPRYLEGGVTFAWFMGGIA